MTRMGKALSALVTVAALGAAGCGSIKVTTPDDDQDSVPSKAGKPSVFVNACTVIDTAAAEAALGVVFESPRLALGSHKVANMDGNSCTWRAGRNASLYATVYSHTHGPEEDATHGSAIEGVGRSARLFLDPNEAEIDAHTAEGAGFAIGVARLGMSTDDLVRIATDVARTAAARVSSSLPGDPAALASQGPPPLELCALLEPQERVEVLGWAARTDDRANVSPDYLPYEEELAPDGGGWQCNLASPDFKRFLRVKLSRKPVPLESWSTTDARVRALPHKAFFDEPPPPDQVLGSPMRSSEILIGLKDGRALSLHLTDDKLDAAQHRDALLKLARLAVPRAGG